MNTGKLIIWVSIILLIGVTTGIASIHKAYCEQAISDYDMYQCTNIHY